MIISSDTNIWLDFESIDHLDYPFLLDNEYYISDFTLHDELSNSNKIKKLIENNKLHIAEVSIKEMELMNQYLDKYLNISVYDALALSLASNRNWILLTGDKNLKIAAEKENIICHGTLWICDELQRNNKLNKKELKELFQGLLISCKKGRRLPINEINSRLIKLK